MSGKRKDVIFYVLMMAFPVIQFIVFYIVVNGGSFLLAFQNINIVTNTTTWTFDSVARMAKMLVTDHGMLTILKTSFVSYFLLLIIGTPLGLLFSYYIFKKLPLSGAFRVILFLPSIISAIVMVTIFQFFVERAVPELVRILFHKTISGLMENTATRFGTVIFYNIWVGFGTGVLMYANGLSGISQEIIDAAHVDGATGFREFWSITLPSIFPTISTFVITGVAGIFTSQLNLLSFYGGAAPEEFVFVLWRSCARGSANFRILSVYAYGSGGVAGRVPRCCSPGLIAVVRCHSADHAGQVGDGKIRSVCRLRRDNEYTKNQRYIKSQTDRQGYRQLFYDQVFP